MSTDKIFEECMAQLDYTWPMVCHKRWFLGTHNIWKIYILFMNIYEKCSFYKQFLNVGQQCLPINKNITYFLIYIFFSTIQAETDLVRSERDEFYKECENLKRNATPRYTFGHWLILFRSFWLEIEKLCKYFTL